MEKDTKVKLSAVVAKIKEDLKTAVDKKITGVAYMYIAGEKNLSISVENIEIDAVDEPAKGEAAENATKEGK